MISSKRAINLLLLFLVALDVALFTIIFSGAWFNIFLGVDLQDVDIYAKSLIWRTGAVWVAFTLLQLIALIRWQKQPYWLVLVAGVRLTELFSDWVYLYASKYIAQDITWFGTLGLFVSPPANLLFGLFLIKSYKALTEK